ncbi:MAG: hypothetical protein K6E59_05840 [Bacilli bacterium]|nr:hypothetical protein [Bacilli bacterium]
MNSHHYGGTVVIAPYNEESYLRAYREAFPEERFRSLTLEEVVGCFGFDVLGELDVEERLIRYVRQMTAPSYKSPELTPYLPLVQKWEKEGKLRRKEDPKSIFCGKTILIRGYYSGKPIAEALQDLPNISLNWDLGRPVLKEEELPRQECRDIYEALHKAEYEMFELFYQGFSPDNVYLNSDVNLPRDYSGKLGRLKRIWGPFVPSDGVAIRLETDHSFSWWKDPFSEKALAELHMVSAETLKKREEEDERCFLRHPNLRARFYFPKEE